MTLFLCSRILLHNDYNYFEQCYASRCRDESTGNYQTSFHQVSQSAPPCPHSIALVPYKQTGSACLHITFVIIKIMYSCTCHFMTFQMFHNDRDGRPRTHIPRLHDGQFRHICYRINLEIKYKDYLFTYAHHRWTEPIGNVCHIRQMYKNSCKILCEFFERFHIQIELRFGL